MSGDKMTEKKWTGRVYVRDLRRGSVHILPKNNILVEFDWRDIKPDTSVWGSIQEKYVEENKKEKNFFKFVPFTRKLKQEEILQILRLTKAEKARVQINRQGQITMWKLL
jgi:hypothetical protein